MDIYKDSMVTHRLSASASLQTNHRVARERGKRDTEQEDFTLALFPRSIAKKARR